MDEKAMLEARVWARVTGQKLEYCPEKEEISGFLEEEYKDLCFYRSLYKMLPQHRGAVCQLIRTAEGTIKYLKTLYFVENAKCYRGKCLENVCISSVCDALRKQYQRVKKGRETYEKGADKWEKAARNKAKEERILLALLEGLL